MRFRVSLRFLGWLRRPARQGRRAEEIPRQQFSHQNEKSERQHRGEAQNQCEHNQEAHRYSPQINHAPGQPRQATTGSTGCCGGWARFKPTIVLAYRHRNIAMMLPPGSPSTSRPTLPPIVSMRTAMRPALDPMNLKLITSLSYAAPSLPLRPGTCRSTCLNNICLGNY